MNALIAPDPEVVDASAPVDERIASLLIERGRLKESDLVRARRLYDEDPKGTLVDLMSRLGLVSERDAVEATAEVLKLPLVAAKDCPDQPPAPRSGPQSKANASPTSASPARTRSRTWKSAGKAMS